MASLARRVRERRASSSYAVHVGEVVMSTAADEEILRFALGRNGVLVTLDADFHAILAVSGRMGPSVIRIRLQGLMPWKLLNVLTSSPYTLKAA
jgi:predicted nuclease of predicted toxin-antitoxin system